MLPIVPTLVRHRDALQQLGSRFLNRNQQPQTPARATLTPLVQATAPTSLARQVPITQRRTTAMTTTTPRTIAPIAAPQAPTFTAPRFTDIGNNFRLPTAAPQVSVNPLNNVPVAQQRQIDWTTPVAAAVPFTALAGDAPVVALGNTIMGGAEAAMNLMDFWGEGRVAAAREAEVARGMGRSGIAVGVEDQVRAQTNLEKANVVQQFVRAQAELEVQVGIANQQAQLQWRELVDVSNRFRATLEQERNLANQQAEIQMRGLQVQQADRLAELAFRREELNANLQQQQQQMLLQASQFDRTFHWQRQLDQHKANLESAQFNEANRQFGLGWQATMRGVDADIMRATTDRDALAWERLRANQEDAQRRILADQTRRQEQFQNYLDMFEFGMPQTVITDDAIARRLAELNRR